MKKRKKYPHFPIYIYPEAWGIVPPKSQTQTPFSGPVINLAIHHVKKVSKKSGLLTKTKAGLSHKNYWQFSYCPYLTFPLKKLRENKSVKCRARAAAAFSKSKFFLHLLFISLMSACDGLSESRHMEGTSDKEAPPSLYLVRRLAVVWRHRQCWQKLREFS